MVLTSPRQGALLAGAAMCAVLAIGGCGASEPVVATYPATGASVSPDGRQVRVNVDGPEPGRGQGVTCEVTADAQQVTLRFVSDPPVTIDPGKARGGVGYDWTVTCDLGEPLGSRALVDGHGRTIDRLP